MGWGGGGGGGGGGVGVGHMHMHMHIVAAVKESWLGTGWATSRPQCMDRLKKNTTLTLNCRELISGKEGCFGSEGVYDNREC